MLLISLSLRFSVCDVWKNWNKKLKIKYKVVFIDVLIDVLDDNCFIDIYLDKLQV